MDTKLVTLIAAAAALLGSAMGANVFGQASQSSGTWQMVADSGGDGGNAWKFNIDTGQATFVIDRIVFYLPWQRHPLGSNSSGGADPRQDRRGPQAW